MGFLKDAYTREYFTGKDKHGNSLGFGALGADDWSNGDIFVEIKEQIDLVELSNKKILEIGYGRCESARYMLQYKDISIYVGVDFSECAFELAKDTLKGYDPIKYELHLDDALNFLKKMNYNNSFDVVFMLDAIEHIPTQEVQEILPLIYQALAKNGKFVVDTPFYPVDEDYIKQDFKYINPSPSDLHPATQGMHCNKYTKNRLINEIENVGFEYISDKIFQKI